jgi:hypothetical protein
MMVDAVSRADFMLAKQTQARCRESLNPNALHAVATVR